MSALGLGLIAADHYYKAGDARAVRERDAQRFNWEQQRALSELSTLPDKIEADRSGHQLRGRQNSASLGLVDSQSDNARKRLNLDGAGLDAALERQPLETASARNNAEVARTLSQFGVEDLPRVIAEKRQQGVFNEVDSGTVAIAKLAELIQQGDDAQVIRFMNGMNATHPPAQRRADVVSVAIEQDKNTGEKLFIAKDASGQDVMRMGASQMKRVRDSVGKSEFKTVNPGDSLVQVRNGAVTPVYTAPESAKSTAARQGPMERDVDYLVRQHGMSKDQALARLNSAKTMTREQFILNSMKDSIAMGRKPTPEDVSSFGALYDNAIQAPAKATAAPAKAAATPAPAAGTPAQTDAPAPAPGAPANVEEVSPEVKEMLGIDSTDQTPPQTPQTQYLTSDKLQAILNSPMFGL